MCSNCSLVALPSSRFSPENTELLTTLGLLYLQVLRQELVPVKPKNQLQGSGTHPLSGSFLFILFFPQLGKYQKAFEHLGNALTFDPSNYKVCRHTAGGSFIQKDAELGLL